MSQTAVTPALKLPEDLPPNAGRAAAGIAIVLVAQLMLVLDMTVVNVALPHYRDPVMTTDPGVASTGWIPGDIEASGEVGGPLRVLEPFGYHPADRFWQFQLIETGILVGITLVLLVTAWRIVLGRKAPATSPAGPPALERLEA